jgi:hypothetical protein
MKRFLSVAVLGLAAALPAASEAHGFYGPYMHGYWRGPGLVVRAPVFAPYYGPPIYAAPRVYYAPRVVYAPRPPVAYGPAPAYRGYPAPYAEPAPPVY